DQLGRRPLTARARLIPDLRRLVVRGHSDHPLAVRTQRCIAKTYAIGLVQLGRPPLAPRANQITDLSHLPRGHGDRPLAICTERTEICSTETCTVKSLAQLDRHPAAVPARLVPDPHRRAHSEHALAVRTERRIADSGSAVVLAQLDRYP